MFPAKSNARSSRGYPLRRSSWFLVARFAWLVRRPEAIDPFEEHNWEKDLLVARFSPCLGPIGEALRVLLAIPDLLLDTHLRSLH